MAPIEVTDDYYATLEVPQTADFAIIKRSYRRLAVLLHPDKNPGKPDATILFQRVSVFSSCIHYRSRLLSPDESCPRHMKQ